jgi:hypothetical protein
MLHGMIYARDAERLGSDRSHDFPDEVHSYFGAGTQLQEMYITPSLLSSQDWDVLAEAAKWSRENADILKDTHWIGGDPARLEIYGWAAWTPAKAIITLRNPSDKAQQFTATIASLLELPTASQSYVVTSPWIPSPQKQETHVAAQDRRTFQLQPFQVLRWELKAQ